MQKTILSLIVALVIVAGGMLILRNPAPSDTSPTTETAPTTTATIETPTPTPVAPTTQVVTPTPTPVKNTVAPTTASPVVCASDIRYCANSSTVSRVSPSCAFKACSDGSIPTASKPTTQTTTQTTTTQTTTTTTTPPPTQTTSTVTPAPAAPSAPSTASVSISGFAFKANAVTIKKGGTVTWTNQDGVGHTVTGDNGGPNSSLLSQGQTYSFTFNTTGTFNYHCAPHPGMTGSVTVID